MQIGIDKHVGLQNTLTTPIGSAASKLQTTTNVTNKTGRRLYVKKTLLRGTDMPIYERVGKQGTVKSRTYITYNTILP
jgi:hypothetical protein